MKVKIDPDAYFELMERVFTPEFNVFLARMHTGVMRKKTHVRHIHEVAKAMGDAMNVRKTTNAVRLEALAIHLSYVLFSTDENIIDHLQVIKERLNEDASLGYR